jgi:hypothetical protein
MREMTKTFYADYIRLLSSVAHKGSQPKVGNEIFQDFVS